MEALPHLPDGLQRKIAYGVLDARIQDSLRALTILQCEDAETTNHHGLTGNPDLISVCGTGEGIVRGLYVVFPIGKVRPLRMDGSVTAYRLRPTRMASGEIGLVEIDVDDNMEQYDLPEGMNGCHAAKVPWGVMQRVKFGLVGWSRATMVTREIRTWKVPRLFNIGRNLGNTAIHVRREADPPQDLPADFEGFDMDSPRGDDAARLEFLNERAQSEEEALMMQDRTV